MKTLGRTSAALALLAVAVAGCEGGTDPAPRPTQSVVMPDLVATTAPQALLSPDVDPAKGQTIATDDFSYTAPKGWVEANDALPIAESLLRDDADDDGFMDNVNVIRLDPAPIADLADLEATSAQELDDAEGTDITVRQRQKVDGSVGIHIAAGLEANGTKYRIEQFNIVRDGIAYVVTFSFSADVPQKERDTLSQSVLTTWSWQD